MLMKRGLPPGCVLRFFSFSRFLSRGGRASYRTFDGWRDENELLLHVHIPKVREDKTAMQDHRSAHGEQRSFGHVVRSTQANLLLDGHVGIVRNRKHPDNRGKHIDVVPDENDHQQEKKRQTSLGKPARSRATL